MRQNQNLFVIRKAKPADAKLLPAIERSAGKAFLALPDLAWIADDDVQSVDRHIELIVGGASWVAVDQHDQPIGFLNAEKLEASLHIWELAVQHEFQGQGIGRGLIEHVIETARSEGAAALTLTTFREVAWNQPFYERLGFHTLDADTMPTELQTLLDNEVANGLPGEKRCAMMLLLRK